VSRKFVPRLTSAGWLRVLKAMARRRAVVLGYHGVAVCSRRDDPFMLTLSPERFRRQLEMMRAAGFEFVTAAELAAAAGGGAPPPGLAAVTFDDGLRNNLTIALPILRELGIRASVYVPTGWIGQTSPWTRGEQGSILNGREIVQLSAAGWEIGAHGVGHPDMAKLDYDGCLAEVRESCRVLAELAGQPVQTFAYPFGNYGEPAIAAVRDAGLLAALTTGSGSWSPFEMTRAMVGAVDPLPVFMLKLGDLYEPLLRTRPLRVARSMSRRLRGRMIDGDRARVGAR
jgi:peptidoglycan/xylan/chitin deacetylase (PgdA/CDA1 family)